MEWFVVHARYPYKLRIQAAGERAELLFIRGLAYCALTDSRGFIPLTQISAFALSGVHSRVNALVRTGLWIEYVQGGQPGYLVRNYDVIQSPMYAAERKRRKDRNRLAARRADPQSPLDSRTTVARSDPQDRTTVGPLQNNRSSPHTPSDDGACHGQHKNCRGCGTTRRQRAKAARNAKPPWCGECDQTTRILGVDSPRRCPKCHPLLRSAESSGNLQREVG